MTVIGNEKLGTFDVQIRVDKQGVFHASLDDLDFTSMTLGDLKDQLRKTAKRLTTTSIPVTVIDLVPNGNKSWGNDDPFMDGAGFVHATLRGQHQRSRGVFLLTADGDGLKFQTGGYSHQWTICHRLTDDEAREYVRVTQALADAQAARDAFVASVKVDPRDLLSKAGA